MLLGEKRIARRRDDLAPGRRCLSRVARDDDEHCVAATDAPLLPHQLDRLAQRAGLGVGRLGGAGEDGSGDIFIAFATGHRALAGGGAKPVTMLGNDSIDPLFYATIEATEEAIVNAMLQAETMTGKDGVTVHRLDPELLREVMRAAGRAPERT